MNKNMTITKPSADFTHRLVQARAVTGLTQAAVAQNAGISTVAYCNYENGRHAPKLKALSAIANVLHVTNEYLLYGTPNNATHHSQELSETMLLYHFRSLTPAQQKIISDMVARLDESNKETVEENTEESESEIDEETDDSVSA